MNKQAKTIKPKVIAVKAWLSRSDYEKARNWAYIHFDKYKPITDTNYEVVPCTITINPPKRKPK